MEPSSRPDLPVHLDKIKIEPPGSVGSASLLVVSTTPGGYFSMGAPSLTSGMLQQSPVEASSTMVQSPTLLSPDTSMLSPSTKGPDPMSPVVQSPTVTAAVGGLVHLHQAQQSPTSMGSSSSTSTQERMHSSTTIMAQTTGQSVSPHHQPLTL